MTQNADPVNITHLAVALGEFSKRGPTGIDFACGDGFAFRHLRANRPAWTVFRSRCTCPDCLNASRAG
jgi:hypothetical protein